MQLALCAPMWRSAGRLSSSALHPFRWHALSTRARRLTSPAASQATSSPATVTKDGAASTTVESNSLASTPPQVESKGEPPAAMKAESNLDAACERVVDPKTNADAVPSTSATAATSSAAPTPTAAAAMSKEDMLASVRAGIAPATGEKLDDIAARIWEWNTDPVGAGQRSGGKILARPLKGALYTSWYPPPPTANKANPFRVSEKQERWREKLRLLRAAGKGPPKKGEGKRKK